MEDHTPESLQKARKLRREMSLPEGLLWNRLRCRPLGVKFRNQHPIEDYICDFYCADKRVAIEIDGKSHDMGNQPARDSQRDAHLRACGVEVVRIPASDVLRDVDAVADSIVRYCLNIPPPSALRAATSPRGGDSSGVAA